MTRLAALVGLVLVLSACGGDGVAPPTSPSRATVFSISGRVSGNGTSLAGASVTITEGLYAGQVRDTTNDGHYRFADMAPSTVKLQAAFPGLVSQSKTVILMSADESVDFVLTDH